MGRRIVIWIALLAIGIPFAVGVSWLATAAGKPLRGIVILLALGLLIGLGVWWSTRVDRTNRAARRARLTPRERIPVEQQVRTMATQRGLSIGDDGAARLAASWNDAADGLSVDPETLRPDDRQSDLIANDRPGQMDNDLGWLEDEVEVRCIDEWLSFRALSPTGRAACGHYRYTLTGLSEAAPCPECGRLNARPIETLADYVLFVGGLLPPRRPESEALRARTATPGSKTTL